MLAVNLSVASDHPYHPRAGAKVTLEGNLVITPEMAAILGEKGAEEVGARIHSTMTLEYLPSLDHNTGMLLPIVKTIETTVTKPDGSDGGSSSQKLVEYYQVTGQGLMLVATQKKPRKLNKPKLMKEPVLILPKQIDVGAQWRRSVGNMESTFTITDVAASLGTEEFAMNGLLLVEEVAEGKLPIVGRLTSRGVYMYSHEKGLVRFHLQSMDFPDVVADEKMSKIARMLIFAQEVAKFDYKITP